VDAQMLELVVVRAVSDAVVRNVENFERSL
jgi:hypothetical protein